MIDENSSELDIVKHALGLALEIGDPAVEDYCDEAEDIGAWAFCKRVRDAADTGQFGAVRKEIAEVDSCDEGAIRGWRDGARGGA